MVEASSNSGCPKAVDDDDEVTDQADILPEGQLMKTDASKIVPISSKNLKAFI